MVGFLTQSFFSRSMMLCIISPRDDLMIFSHVVFPHSFILFFFMSHIIFWKIRNPRCRMKRGNDIMFYLTFPFPVYFTYNGFHSHLYLFDSVTVHEWLLLHVLSLSWRKIPFCTLNDSSSQMRPFINNCLNSFTCSYEQVNKCILWSCA